MLCLMLKSNDTIVTNRCWSTAIGFENYWSFGCWSHKNIRQCKPPHSYKWVCNRLCKLSRYLSLPLYRSFFMVIAWSQCLVPLYQSTVLKSTLHLQIWFNVLLFTVVLELSFCSSSKTYSIWAMIQQDTVILKEASYLCLSHRSSFIII